MTVVTRILQALEQGNPRAASQFLPLIYDELRRSAAHKIDTRPRCSPATIHTSRLHGDPMGPQGLRVPQFRADGYLPEGLHLASEAEVLFRFGSPTRRRRRLALRLRRWVELARQVGGRRLLLDGRFVTAKDKPNDIDAVILLPPDFQEQVEQGIEPALELEEMLMTRLPEEIFAAEDEADWNEWVEFFSRTREADGRRKGLVEIVL